LSVRVIQSSNLFRGNTHGEWTARYWQWLLSISKEFSPLYDKTGENSQQQQAGPVFFLVNAPENATVHRVASVPKSKAILCPINTSLCTNVEHPNLSTQELRIRTVKQESQVSKIGVTVDGKGIMQSSNVDLVEHHRIDSPVFNIQLKENNILGIKVDCDKTLTCTAVSDGYWIMLGPIEEGRKTKLHMIAEGTCEVDQEQEITFKTDVTYDLISIPDSPNAFNVLDVTKTMEQDQRMGRKKRNL